jgi:uridine kinase
LFIAKETACKLFIQSFGVNVKAGNREGNFKRLIYMIDVIRIFVKNTKEYVEVAPGATLLDVYAAAGSPLKLPPMNAIVNNKVERLTYRCWQAKDVEFSDYTSLSGQRAYVRSLCHILSKAVHDIIPAASLRIEHPVSKGYYCVIKNGGQYADAETVGRIRSRMEEIISADIPFIYRTKHTNEAAAMFRSLGMEDKAALVDTAGFIYTSYYELDGHRDYFYGCLTPSTGYVKVFDLVPYAEGVLLRIPQRNNPSALEEMVRQDKMFGVYKESRSLLNALGVTNVGDFNLAVKAGRGKEIILVAEAMQEKQIAGIAEKIATKYSEGLRIVLISGPSSSGKTTFAQRLGIQLMTNYYHPFSLSLDDYFVDRKNTPRDETGDYDFESIYALDLDYFNRDLTRLLSGEEIDMPTYDFTTGTRIYRGKKLKLKENSLLIIEGIHALNPELTAHINPRHIYKVYVSALTSISLDDHNWIPTADNRLLRRIVRDYRFRNYSPVETIARWPSVRKGEDKWIYPYQETADAMFNSAMLYELAVLRRYAEPILAEVREDEREYAEAYRLLRFLRYFNFITDHDLPATSLLREFFGGGTFHY